MELSDIHCSVLLQEVISYLAPKDGGVYMDGNLGMGGHSEAILESSGPSGQVIGFEWDKDAMELAGQRLARFGSRITFVRDNFANLKDRLVELDIPALDGLLLDLGLSSFQLDKSGRGFSFQGSEPLDMRMDDRGRTTAAKLLNQASEQDLADIFYHYGEDRQARRIAKFVVEARRKEPLSTTGELVSLVEKAVPPRFRPKKIHVATKVFQGLRIAVNRELDNLDQVLSHGVEMLKPGASFCVISFHSLEDRLVKRAFRGNESLEVLTNRPVIAGDDECQANPRARSAKLRVARKLKSL